MVKKYLAGFVAGCLLTLAPAFAQATETAQVTLTVTKFNPINPTGEIRLVDYTASMKPHSRVSMVDRAGMPTFICKSAIDFEVTIASTDGETYRPLAITFQQYTDGVPADKKDVAGHANFERLAQATPANAISFRSKAARTGPAGRYEFFVLIQRVSDGAIGLIDPYIENDINE